MLEFKRGILGQELFSRPGIQGFEVRIEERKEKCIVYPPLSGEARSGDEVILNTTAVRLGLGSGGYHYVIANLRQPDKHPISGGHIMKMRYTPMQLKVLSVEEEDSPHRQAMLEAESLDNTPVLVATLHSMLAPLALYLHGQGYRTAYLMTDGAALPMAFSNTVNILKERNIICGSVTVGHAFGGDLEAVNVYSGLLAAKKVLQADVIVSAMGPGIVGTGSKWGFTGVEQGDILNAVESLQGIPIAVPRISFADARERHRGISHHTLTVLKRICRVEAILPLPELEVGKMSYILEQMSKEELWESYICCLERVESFQYILNNSPVKLSTMGRGLQEEPEFFQALLAAARVAERVLRGERLNQIRLA
ncbi:MAG: DUF3866 family protein [Syntrophomonadaceae bacterium]|jgi:hypothetical protein|nr:DUF3866 family protein [Syntrophomonadaceae bacterium]